MADWDVNSAELELNLRRVLKTIRDGARGRSVLSTEKARKWHAETLRGLAVPDSRYVGRFRGEAGLEQVQVDVGGQFGVVARDVAAALAAFVLEVCAWAHAEWIRIHRFANGNGRIARFWVNSIAMRYNLPPFLTLRPRPDGGYSDAGAAAMRGHWQPTIVVLRESLTHFLKH